MEGFKPPISLGENHGTENDQARKSVIPKGKDRLLTMQGWAAKTSPRMIFFLKI